MGKRDRGKGTRKWPEGFIFLVLFLIATACSDAPEGHDHWALRLLADRLVELGVVAYEDDGEPVAIGKDGARNPHTGDVVGDDPLEPFLFFKDFNGCLKLHNRPGMV